MSEYSRGYKHGLLMGLAALHSQLFSAAERCFMPIIQLDNEDYNKLNKNNYTINDAPCPSNYDFSINIAKTNYNEPKSKFDYNRGEIPNILYTKQTNKMKISQTMHISNLPSHFSKPAFETIEEHNADQSLKAGLHKFTINGKVVYAKNKKAAQLKARKVHTTSNTHSFNTLRKKDFWV